MKKLCCFLLLVFPGFGLRLMAQVPPITDYYWYGYTHNDAGDVPFIVLFEPGGKALKVSALGEEPITYVYKPDPLNEKFGLNGWLSIFLPDGEVKLDIDNARNFKGPEGPAAPNYVLTDFTIKPATSQLAGNRFVGKLSKAGLNGEAGYFFRFGANNSSYNHGKNGKINVSRPNDASKSYVLYGNVAFLDAMPSGFSRVFGLVDGRGYGPTLNIAWKTGELWIAGNLQNESN